MTGMGKREELGSSLQRRIRAHARRVFEKNDYRSQQQMADDMGISQGYLSRVFSAETPAGTDFIIGLGKAANESLDVIVHVDPRDERLFKEYVPKYDKRTGKVVAMPVAEVEPEETPTTPDPLQPPRDGQSRGQPTGGRKPDRTP